jgi:ribonuclease HII
MKSHLHPELTSLFEIGVDEVGRGPLFGRVYTAAVVLPKNNESIDFSQMRDSKKFHSKKKIEAVAEYIKSIAITYSIDFEDENCIDEINILQATQKSMHKSILAVRRQLPNQQIHLVIDGNYFNPLPPNLNKATGKLELIPYTLVEQGDNKICVIAAASILAKVARDKYIEELCIANPDLIVKYGIDSNKGYGSKKHMDGIKEYGITPWHRKTFKPCCYAITPPKDASTKEANITDAEHDTINNTL